MTLKRQFLWSMAPLVAITALNIFSVPLFINYLGEDMYALWFYVATFVGVFGFADLGLGVAVGRYVGVALGKGDDQSMREYWGTGNVLALPLLGLMALIFVLVGVFFGPHWFNVSPGNKGLLQACFITGGFALFLNFYSQIWNILLQAHLDFKFSNLLRIVTTLLQVVPAIFIAKATRNPFLINLWGALVSLLQVLLVIGYCKRTYQVGLCLKAAKRPRALEMSVYTGKTFLTIVTNSLFASIDRVMLGKWAPAADFSHYVVGANVGNRLQGLGTSVMGPVFHNTSRTAAGVGSAAKIYDETFSFVFGWYLLAALWVVTWHWTLLRVWLGADLGAKVAPLFVPLILSSCINGIANISSAQLGALNRVGAALGFSIVAGLMALAGVYVGWRAGGVVGAAYGFLLSRTALLAQDLFTIRLVKGQGWLGLQTWLIVIWQAALSGVFSLAYLIIPHGSLWLLLPCFLHGTLAATWMLRKQLRQILSSLFAAAGRPPVPAIL